MKRKIIFFLASLLVFLTAVFFSSCTKEKVDPVVIDLNGVTVEENATLLEVMTQMRTDGELAFELSDGMIVGINGVRNSVTYNPCWMLYTSDDDPAASNTAWGTYEYDGRVLASAAVGAESLLVKTGEIYVWVYQSF